MAHYVLDDLLRTATEQRASDLHLRVGLPPMFRVDGHLAPMKDGAPLTRDMMAGLAKEALSDEQVKKFTEHKYVDLSRKVEGCARFRVNIFLQQGLMGGVFRRIPDQIPSLADLAAPAVLLDFAREPRGLVLVTGPTGSGKSTTLASVLDVINQERSDHILTIEDPIEFVHQPKRCVVNQREIGRDATSFSQALRAALRQDPDVILVGEMRDLETISTAITAAETGHLVFGTLHTSTAESTISRVVDAFPPDQQETIRVMLAASLKGIVCQTLLPRSDGPGRVAAHEVLRVNNAVANMIRKNDMAQARGAMQTSSNIGMQTMDRALAYLVYQGKISEDVARERSVRIDEFEDTLNSFRKGGRVAIPVLVQPGQGIMNRTAPGGGMATGMGMPGAAPPLPPQPGQMGAAPGQMSGPGAGMPTRAGQPMADPEFKMPLPPQPAPPLPFAASLAEEVPAGDNMFEGISMSGLADKAPDGPPMSTSARPASPSAAPMSAGPFAAPPATPVAAPAPTQAAAAAPPLPTAAPSAPAQPTPAAPPPLPTAPTQAAGAQVPLPSDDAPALSPYAIPDETVEPVEHYIEPLPDDDEAMRQLLALQALDDDDTPPPSFG